MNLVDSCGWLEYFADSPYADVCVFRTKTASVPAGKRPPFRWKNGQRSDWKAATIPVKTASTN